MSDETRPEMASETPDDASGTAGGKSGKQPGQLRLRRVQLRYKRATGLADPKRGANALRRLQSEVLEAIAKGEVGKRAQHFAAASLGMEIPEPKGGRKKKDEEGGEGAERHESESV